MKKLHSKRQEAFESLGIVPNNLAYSHIIDVFESVAEHLDEMESEVFHHWKTRYHKELRKSAEVNGEPTNYRLARGG